MRFTKINREGILLITLEDGQQTLMTIAPQYGARILDLSLRLNKAFHRILWPVSLDDLKTNDWFKNTVLFPYPNRLEGGKFTFQGKSYQWPINEPDKNNQLHGMVFSAPFDVGELQESDDSARITMVHRYDGSFAYFPFPFLLEVTFFYGFDHFKVAFNVQNTGSSDLPFGIGWHPYFQLDGHAVSSYQLKIPELIRMELNENSIPTGKSSAYPIRIIDLQTTQLDDAFKIPGRDRGCALRDSQTKVQLKMKASDGFDYLQIFTPPGCESVAIEPMTCNINALNNEEGLRVLKKGDSFS